MPHTMESYLSRQPTALLELLEEAARNNAQSHSFDVGAILSRRRQLLQKYSRSKLRLMTEEELNHLINSPELHICDLVASKTIMADILDLLPEGALVVQPALTDYLRKWESFSVETEPPENT